LIRLTSILRIVRESVTTAASERYGADDRKQRSHFEFHGLAASQ